MKQVIEWIPSDNPPEHGNYILLSFLNFSGISIGRYERDGEGGGAYYEGDEDRPCISYDLYVDAWAEQPKNYRTLKQEILQELRISEDYHDKHSTLRKS